MAPVRGEVWLWDLGVVEKVRPALVVSVQYGDRDRALIAVAVAFLKPGAFLMQNVATYPAVRAVRKLGVLKKEQCDRVSE